MCDSAVEAQGGVLALLMPLPAHLQCNTWILGASSWLLLCVGGNHNTAPCSALCKLNTKYKSHPTDIVLVLVALLGVSSNSFLSCLSNTLKTHSQNLEISKAQKTSRISFCSCARENY